MGAPGVFEDVSDGKKAVAPTACMILLRDNLKFIVLIVLA
jgi:hypothetical protein